ncbi:MAG: S8 family serine peptidase [Gammaproteobacteria bacterium]|nr:S8 family serine peptidase [Gammaproteobacteria bacterium]
MSVRLEPASTQGFRRIRAFRSMLLPVAFAIAACDGGGGVEPAPDRSLLIVVSGDGRVTSTPSGIDCGPACSTSFHDGTVVTLTASPGEGSGVLDWGTAVCGTSEMCRIALTADTTVNVTFSGDDPLFALQWHLDNRGQTGGTANEDVNVLPVWTESGIRGRDVRTVVVDDGLEVAHEDLAPNVVEGAGWNYLSGTPDPTPPAPSLGNPADLAHGTSVAGLIAARDRNGKGVRGVAPLAGLVGYNLLVRATSVNEGDAMARDAVENAVSNNSWGPTDGQGTLDHSSFEWREGVRTGLTQGRNGRGIVYVWAAGNGAPRDNSNYDAYANHRGVITVASVDHDGRQSFFSERGANLWVSAPGMPSLVTTDRTGEYGFNSTGSAGNLANNNYTNGFGGTSAAAPLVSGVVALMLEANPTLGWRDVRLILAQTARRNDPADPGWADFGTAPAYHFNHRYGFGVVDAAAAVEAARTWTNVGPQISAVTAESRPSLPIPDNDPIGASDTITASGTGIRRIEFIEVTFSAQDHGYSGDLEVVLTSPTGARSTLAETHTCANDACSVYLDWVFGSARHLGEGADGTWQLTVRDGFPGDAGTFRSWRLAFYGTGPE